MDFGQVRYEENNILLNSKFAEKQVLICAHRGSWHGNITQNTNLAYKAALLQGADILETDTTATVDDVVFSLHDGVEPRLFGLPRRCSLQMTASEIDAIQPLNALAEPSTHKVQRLAEIFAALDHGELINVDRSWRAKGLVLSVLDAFPYMRLQAIIKAPLSEKQVIQQLQAHPIKYMFMPICYSLEEVKEALSFDELNMVGIELIAHSEKDDLYSDEAIRFIHAHNLFCWVNALVISDCYPKAALYGTLNDDVSIANGPDAGWGILMDKGIDVIQTDWPSILRDYRFKRLSI
ncbi:MAG: glycerophosphodiester phosphodiesterase family protein [Oscillospiraceae bacterium]|nr:glycerophosphodiester phosphodiesterase family protein [Oscillospiraceae bacterium]